jgi:hypothetical protein
MTPQSVLSSPNTSGGGIPTNFRKNGFRKNDLSRRNGLIHKCSKMDFLRFESNKGFNCFILNKPFMVLAETFNVLSNNNILQKQQDLLSLTSFSLSSTRTILCGFVNITCLVNKVMIKVIIKDFLCIVDQNASMKKRASHFCAKESHLRDRERCVRTEKKYPERVWRVYVLLKDV